MMQTSTENIDSVYTNSVSSNATAFRQGLHDGIPIGLGYFAVAFSLGIILDSMSKKYRQMYELYLNLQSKECEE